ncbi:hypothetical protein GQ43DRAFT_163618 [Delitschia confertaspora ATCC 74209]|uniref:Secreted protein n=1 Tax=Delitschia confertaspora ATCC 74209 TaxID=1513339 RepID=A0A9P4MPY2_9PLEO|nr:hypothetical protein GQ43DRAFT_163618 [Delitschia confertaspora ATCC 74209]
MAILIYLLCLFCCCPLRRSERILYGKDPPFPGASKTTDTSTMSFRFGVPPSHVFHFFPLLLQDFSHCFSTHTPLSRPVSIMYPTTVLDMMLFKFGRAANPWTFAPWILV